MAALLILLPLVLLLDRLLFAPLLLEAGVVPGPQRQLGMVQVQDVVADGIQQLTVVADDEDGRRVALEVLDEPERAFEIEIVGRLVEEQQVRLGEQDSRQRDAHPPAAGKGGERARLRREVETEPGEDARRARRGGMGIDVDETRVDVGDALRVVRCFSLGHQPRALAIGLEHEVDQRAGPPGRLLFHAAEPHLLRHGKRAEVRRKLFGDHPEERGLAGPVASDKADPGAFGQRGRGLVEQDTRAEPQRDVVDVEHARFSLVGPMNAIAMRLDQAAAYSRLLAEAPGQVP